MPRHSNPEARRAPSPMPRAISRQGEEPLPPVQPGSSPISRFAGILLGTLAAVATFALAEAIDSAGLNPFEAPAAVAVSSPAPATERAGNGAGR